MIAAKSSVVSTALKAGVRVKEKDELMSGEVNGFRRTQARSPLEERHSLSMSLGGTENQGNPHGVSGGYKSNPPEVHSRGVQLQKKNAYDPPSIFFFASGRANALVGLCTFTSSTLA